MAHERELDDSLLAATATDPEAFGKLNAVSNIGRQFNPGGRAHAAFPGLGGWCCAR
jgi:hypothetical protein